MDQNHFYVLDRPEQGSPGDRNAGIEAMRTEDANCGDAPKCPKCDGFIGPLTWLPPYQVDIELWGKEFGDIANVDGENLIVSDRFKRLYQTHQLSGLSGFEKAEIVSMKRRRKSQGEPPQYFKASVIRSRAAVDQEASGCRWKYKGPVCPECLWKKQGDALKAYSSIAIKPGTWQGEDIFQARGSPEAFLVSERFKDLCVKNGVTNVVFLAADRCAWREEDDWK